MTEQFVPGREHGERDAGALESCLVSFLGLAAFAPETKGSFQDGGQALDAESQTTKGRLFRDLSFEDQTDVLSNVQTGETPFLQAFFSTVLLLTKVAWVNNFPEHVYQLDGQPVLTDERQLITPRKRSHGRLPPSPLGSADAPSSCWPLMGRMCQRVPMVPKDVDGVGKRQRAKRARWKGVWREAKSFRFSLLGADRLVHVCSWHQVYSDQELAEAHRPSTPRFGGSSAGLLELDWNGRVVWEYANSWLHHDFERLANGNTLAFIWAPIPAELPVRVRGGYTGDDGPEQMLGDVIHEIPRTALWSENGVPGNTSMSQKKLFARWQYLRHLSGVDSVVDPPKCSHLGDHLINTNGIGPFRKPL